MPEDRPSPPASESAAAPEATFTIDDLTARAGVTVRTVRYYIGEGLLPPPAGAGPGTRYTQEHLDRLLLIGALKDRYLPLREIRRRFQGMDVATIRETVAGLDRWGDPGKAERPERRAMLSMPARSDAAQPESGSASGNAPASAASYIDAVLQREPGERRHRRSTGGSRPSTPERGEIRFPGAPGTAPPDMFPLPDDPDERRWRKLAITPEAELTIENELYHRRREQIESLIAHIRRVLTSS